MTSLKGAAILHKKQFYSYHSSTGIPVLVHQPAMNTVVGNPAARVLGVPSTALGPIGRTDTVKAIVNYGYTAGTSPFANHDTMPAAIRSVGQAENMDVLLRCRVEDVLIEESKGGRSLFDTAKSIELDGMLYKVVATDRTGLPPVGPYVFWVALKKNGSAT